MVDWAVEGMDGVLNKVSDDLLLAPLEIDLLIFVLGVGLTLAPTGVGLVNGLSDPRPV